MSIVQPVRQLRLPITMFSMNPEQKADYSEIILDTINLSISEADREVKTFEDWYFNRLMAMRTTDKDDETDYTLTYSQLKVKLAKAEKNVWVAVKNHNWVLTEPFRQKMRQISDELMEHLELGIQKGWVSERDYINRSNEFAKALTMTEKVSVTLKMWFAVMPLNRNQLNQWWG